MASFDAGFAARRSPGGQAAGDAVDAYLWLDRPRAGAENMAIDEAMADWSAARGVACLRFYRWLSPTLSLGYFQAADDRLADSALAALPFTRRLSGGGAIVHDRELTYSLAVPQAGFSKSAAEPLYRSMHAAIAAALRAAGYDAQSHEQWTAASPAADLPVGSPNAFLCFERRSPIDLVIGGAKVVGSAQRRLAGVLLQHGSVLLSCSDAAPHLPGLAQLPQALEVAGDFSDVSQLDQTIDEPVANRVIAACWENLTQSINPEGSASSMQTGAAAEIEARAADLAAAKYTHVSWTHRN